MTGNIRIIRPAGAAIAAVLAFNSPPLLAQTVVPPVTPEGVASPAPPPASGPVFAPTQPVIQPTLSVDERLNAAITASKAEAAARPAPALMTVPERAVTAKKAATDRSVADRAAAPAKAAPPPPPVASEPVRTQAPIETAAPADAPLAQAQAPTAMVGPAKTSEAQRPMIDPALIWALGGGVLILLGLAGVALMRRSNGDEEDALELEPAMPVEAAVTRPASPPLTSPSVNRPVPAKPVSTDSRLEAMVAAPPSPENPFQTHAKRMTRAKFLLAQEEKAQAAPTKPENPAPVAYPAVQEHNQTVYRFGSDRTGRKTLFNPRPS
ncbi:hypothetical protein CAF53_09345 [Sphingobium sp. LB126]|nr:hypothetical protein CAF53_09345 [Sphingobium sp. LB126]